MKNKRLIRPGDIVTLRPSADKRWGGDNTPSVVLEFSEESYSTERGAWFDEGELQLVRQATDKEYLAAIRKALVDYDNDIHGR